MRKAKRRAAVFDNFDRSGVRLARSPSDNRASDSRDVLRRIKSAEPDPCTEPVLISPGLTVISEAAECQDLSQSYAAMPTKPKSRAGGVFVSGLLLPRCISCRICTPQLQP